MASWLELDIEIDPSRSGWQKTICPACSHTRRNRREKCLSANTDVGFYRCHHCGFSGWLDETEWRDRMTSPRAKTYSRPEPVEDDLHADAVVWFASYGIPEQVVRRNRVAASATTISFPYFRNGSHVNTKYRRYPVKGFRMDAGAELCLYGLDDIGASTTLTIVEGERDKLAIEVATGDLAVVSVPNGASKAGSLPSLTYLESATSMLDGMKRIVLAGDGDEAGRSLREEIARRVGRDRVWLVEWPVGCNDASDTLRDCGGGVVAACLQDAEPFPLDGVIRPIDLLDRVKALRVKATSGVVPGWPSLDRIYRVAEGQLTVVTGVPSSGKSAFLNAMFINIARETGWTFGLCSPETWPPEEHVRTLAEIYTGKPLVEVAGPTVGGERGGPKPMTDGEIEEAVSWVNRYFTLILPEPIGIDAIIERSSAVHMRDGLKGFLVDPWNRLGHEIPRNMSETQYVGHVLSRLQMFARSRGLHVWLVAHPTKMQSVPDDDGEAKAPIVRPYDISGSANFYNMADNILSIYRDKRDPSAPVTVYVQKVRFRQYGELGSAALGFDRVTGRYVEA